MSSLLDRIEKHPALAAQVQVAAIIVAIAGTWLAGWLLRRSGRHTERHTVAKAVSEIAMAAETLARSVMSELPDKQAVSVIAAGEKPFDIHAIDELEAAIAAIQLHNLSTPELVRGVITLLTDIRQLREQLTNTIATYHRMDATHFSEFFETSESVQAAITKTSKSIAAHVSQIQSSVARPAITPTGRIAMLGFDPRTGRIIQTVFLFALAILIIYKIASVLLVAVFAVFSSRLLYPLIEQLERRIPRQAPRSVSIGVVFILVVLVVIVADSVFGATVQEEAGKPADQLPELLDTNTMIDRLALPNFLEPLRARILELLREQLSTTSDQAMPLVRNIGLDVMYAASNLAYLVLIPIMSFLMINEASSIRAALLSWIRSSDKRPRGNIIDDLDTLLPRYVCTLLLLSLVTLLFYSIAFYLLGVPYALLLATTAAVLEFTPFAGPLAAVVAIVTVAVFSGYPHLFWLIGFIVVYRLFQDYVLNPYLMSGGIKVSPFLIIVGLLTGEQLDGVADVFLLVPVIAAPEIVLSHAWVAQSLGREAR